MEIRFVVLAPASQKRSVPVRLPILVGRSDEAKFRVQQDSVSRRHCEFFLKDDAVYVRDLGSTNGTLLDDEEIAASVATIVPPGTVVRVGGVAFRVDYESATCRPAATGDDTVPLPASGAEEASPADQAATGFVGIAPAEEPAGGGLVWPTDEAASAPPASDDNLNDFFKSFK